MRLMPFVGVLAFFAFLAGLQAVAPGAPSVKPGSKSSVPSLPPAAKHIPTPLDPVETDKLLDLMAKDPHSFKIAIAMRALRHAVDASGREARVSITFAKKESAVGCVRAEQAITAWEAAHGVRPEGDGDEDGSAPPMAGERK